MSGKRMHRERKNLALPHVQPAPVSTMQKILGPVPSVPEPKENSMVGRVESTGTGKGDLGLPANTFTRVKVRVPLAPP